MEWYKKQLEQMTLTQLYEQWNIVVAPLKEYFNNKPDEVKTKRIERTHIGGKVFS